MKPRVRLERIHIETATRIGRQRFANAVREGRKSSNRGPESEENHIHGALGECAGYLWIKRYVPTIKWNASTAYQGKIPDIGSFIDAKTIQEAHLRLLVETRNPVEWAYLLVDGSQHPDYTIIGWLWGREAKQFPISDPVGDAGGEKRPAHFIPQAKLWTPESLIDEVRLRDA